MGNNNDADGEIPLPRKRLAGYEGVLYTSYEMMYPVSGRVTEIRVPTLRWRPDGTTFTTMDTYRIRTFDDFKCFRYETGLT